MAEASQSAAPAATAAAAAAAAVPEIEPDNFHDNDADSAVAVSDRTDFTSLHSSVMAYLEENGRTYHAKSVGRYAFPNDERELGRLDLQHHLFRLTLDGKLCLCPKEGGAKRVLDVGTGTGIWAVDYADEHPEAEVVGMDISPVQSSFVPPNCRFEVDDIEKEWLWTEPFDFIFSRVLAGSLADTDGFIKNAFKSLEPGGYLEMEDVGLPVKSDDGTLADDAWLVKMSHLTVEAAEKFGRPINLAWNYKEMMEAAGFVDVSIHHFKWPSNLWPRDKKYKEMGRWNFANIDGGMEGLVLAYFTRGLGMSAEEALAICAGARAELKNHKIHAYWPIIVCYGRKPDAPKEE